MRGYLTRLVERAQLAPPATASVAQPPSLSEATDEWEEIVAIEAEPAAPPVPTVHTALHRRDDDVSSAEVRPGPVMPPPERAEVIERHVEHTTTPIEPVPTARREPQNLAPRTPEPAEPSAAARAAEPVRSDVERAVPPQFLAPSPTQTSFIEAAPQPIELRAPAAPTAPAETQRTPELTPHVSPPALGPVAVEGTDLRDREPERSLVIGQLRIDVVGTPRRADHPQTAPAGPVRPSVRMSPQARLGAPAPSVQRFGRL